ncbi:MAG: DUF2939 domain-containing protein [Phenylobacterium sp.]
MFRPGALAAVSLLVLALTAPGLTGCSLDVRADAAQGVARFLDAVHDGDRKAFEASIDRPALRSALRGQLADLARANGLDVEGGASDFALDRMITPEAFRLVEARSGRPVPAAPTAAQVAVLMKVADKSHVCLGDPSQARCILSFAKRDGVWRLTGMQATELKVVALPPPPAAKAKR